MRVERSTFYQEQYKDVLPGLTRENCHLYCGRKRSAVSGNLFYVNGNYKYERWNKNAILGQIEILAITF